MFIRYNIDRIISLYDQGKIDSQYIDSEGEKHLDKWRNIAELLHRVKDDRLTTGQMASRFSYSFIDRTRSIPSLIKTHIDESQLIPTGKPKSLDILDLCLDRATEILNTDKHINILWSGGVDSTMLLFSIIHQCRNFDQLSIICTFESVVESGGMFDALIKNLGIRIKFDQTRCNVNHPYTYDNEDPTQLYITGQCADQLFGANGFLRLNDADEKSPWYNAYDQATLDLIEPTLKFSDRPIETVRDVRWWGLFNYSWTSVLYDDCIERPPHVGSRIVSFFATPEFQRWALHTPTYYEIPSYYEDRRGYKFPLKQALGRIINYPYYIQNKGKGMSFAWKKNHNWYLLDKNFNTYYIDQ